MTKIVEVFWNAKPHLVRRKIKVGGGVLDPRAEKMFDVVRGVAATAFPGAVTLVRIATRSGPEEELRVTQDGEEQADGLDALKAAIDVAVEQALEPPAETLASELDGAVTDTPVPG